MSEAQVAVPVNMYISAAVERDLDDQGCSQRSVVFAWVGANVVRPISMCCMEASRLRIEMSLSYFVWVIFRLPPPYVPAQAVKGEACTEFKAKRRARCAHTLAVAVFSRIGLDSTASSTGEGGAAGGSSGGSGLPRTPTVFLDRDAASYISRLKGMLTYIQRLALPPTRPSGLARLSEEPAKRFTVSQTQCTCGGKLILQAVEDAKLVTEVSCGFGLWYCSGFSQVVS